jgi:SAM-dependent methyltransferase
MGMAYRLMYLLGFTPWDRLLPPELSNILEGPGALAPGRALDLGSGLGRKSIYIASRGWQVTGVEMVPRALDAARRRAQEAGVSVDFRQGDVTHLGRLGLAPGYTLVFDFGCYHGLKMAERGLYADGVTSLAAPGARLLMMAFSKPLPPVTLGVTESDLQDRFGIDWDLLWAKPSEEAGTSAMKRARATWFCLVHR